MSNSRQHDSLELVRSYGVTLSQTQLVPPVSETWNVLVYASKGIVTVRTEAGTWVVPPYRAVWLPANMKAKLDVAGQTALRMIYLRSQRRTSKRMPFDPKKCAVINVNPLLRELILRVVRIGALNANVPNHQRIARLIQDELNTVGTVPLQLPYPQCDQAMQFVSIIEGSFESEIEIGPALNSCGSSRRTMERLFRAETGMSLGQWVRRRKLLEGLRRMSGGESATSVAFHLGYSSPSAFIAMFKRELGAAPGSYFSNRLVE
jgi:AraC-like DNA-binding protein